MTDKENFIEAVWDDEYAELELGDGVVLITDWEGDGSFLPYAVTHDTDEALESEEYLREREMQIGDLIAEELGVRVDEVEYDENNNVFVPYMERP